MSRQWIRVAAVVSAICLGVTLALAQTAPPAQEISITSKSPQALEAFKKGRDLLDNARVAESMAQFQKAVELDPDFAVAHAFLGTVTPGSAAVKELERATALAAKLPQAEKLLVEYLVAQAQGDEARTRDRLQKLVDAAPGDWHVRFNRGVQFYGDQKWDEAAADLKRATELNPKAGAPFNLLGYVYLEQKKNDAAIEAFKKYAALSPSEPNPHDSLAEALLMAGRFEEAETAFRKAAEVSPEFHIAWEGVAQTRFLRGDWPGGFEALDKSRAAAPRPVDKLFVDVARAYSQLAQGRPADAFATLDALEKEAQTQKLDFVAALAPVHRANLLVRTNKPEEALKQVALGVDRGTKAALPGGEMNAVRRSGLATRIEAEARLGKAADAQKTLALIEQEAKKDSRSAFLQSSLHYAHGMTALAGGDAKGAVTHLAQCPEQFSYHRLQLSLAQERAGDASGAAKTRALLVETPRREAGYLYVRTQIADKEGGLSKRP